MLFNSLRFAIFFPIVCMLFFVLPKKCRAAWLLIASYFFYMNWNAAYALLIALSTVTTYLTGLWIEKSDRFKKAALATCLVVNFSILFYFKYFIFLIDSINRVISPLGVNLNVNYSVILPVGISFYTFQAVGYIIDVYRKEISAERNFINYSLFVSFFPQLVAGPIERSKNLLNQIRAMELSSNNNWDWNRIKHGLIYMLYGFFLKMVLADQLALVVDYGYDNLAFLGSIELIIVAMAFSLQIYCDFYSYSIIAIGAAQVLGFTLMENFDAPYFAGSIKEFWRRWHISLSTWFKDYLYIPLGGNRVGKIKIIRNIIVVFLLSGLWHGANWTFVVWGGLHGIYQILGNAFLPVRRKVRQFLDVRDDSEVYMFSRIVGTFILTSFAWIFFRANTLSQALLYIEKILLQWNPWVLFDGSLKNTIFSVNVVWIVLAVALLILMTFDVILYRKKVRFDAFVCSQGYFIQNVIIAVLLILILIFGVYGYGFDAKAFVYFQF